MIARGQKDNAPFEAQDKETQRARSFAEQEGEGRLSCGADLAEEWESDSDGGRGTSYLPFLCGREVEVRPGFYRGPAATVNSGECAVPVRGDGSPILPGASREESSGRVTPENWRQNT